MQINTVTKSIIMYGHYRGGDKDTAKHAASCKGRRPDFYKARFEFHIFKQQAAQKCGGCNQAHTCREAYFLKGTAAVECAAAHFLYGIGNIYPYHSFTVPEGTGGDLSDTLGDFYLIEIEAFRKYTVTKKCEGFRKMHVGETFAKLKCMIFNAFYTVGNYHPC